MTLLSRILGFIRDLLIARIFGVSFATDAFFVAFKIPNFFRRLFVEGVFAQAIVPSIIEFDRAGQKHELKKFINNVGCVWALFLIVIASMGVLAAPFLVIVFAPGFVGKTQQFELSEQMLRIMMPYLLFIVLVAYAGSILNAKEKFAIPAFAPVILNVSMICFAIWYSPSLSEPVTALAWGVLVAGVVQLLLLILPLFRLNLLPRLSNGFKDPRVLKTFKNMIPAFFALSVTQINLLLDTFMASFLPAGNISWLYYSDRLVEFPSGILGAALATVILPKLSKEHLDEKEELFSKSIDWGLKWVMLFSVPSAVGLILLAEPILFTLFQHEEFTIEDVYSTSLSLKAYAFGLIGIILIKILVSAFSASKDLLTPMKIGGFALLSNFILNLVLIVPYGHAGLAFATSVAAYINALLLFWGLLKTNKISLHLNWLSLLAKIGLASMIMGLMLNEYGKKISWSTLEASERIINLMLIIGSGVIVYFFVLYLFRVKVNPSSS